MTPQNLEYYVNKNMQSVIIITYYLIIFTSRLSVNLSFCCRVLLPPNGSKHADTDLGFGAGIEV